VFAVVDGRARATAVQTGIRDGRVRELLGGLGESATVILHPSEDLEDGARVEPLPD